LPWPAFVVLSTHQANNHRFNKPNPRPLTKKIGRENNNLNGKYSTGKGPFASHKKMLALVALVFKWLGLGARIRFNCEFQGFWLMRLLIKLDFFIDVPIPPCSLLLSCLAMA